MSWAADEAARRQVGLRILTAYEWPWLGSPLGVVGDKERAVRGQAEEVVDTAVAAAALAHPGLSVSGVAVQGNPSGALLSAADDAYLVVVGNRGRGGFASLLLGSVSQRVAFSRARTSPSAASGT